MGAPAGNHDERVFRFDVGPTRWHPQQVPVRVTVDNPVLTPPLYTIDEVNFTAKERMEWMRNTDRIPNYSCMTCSSLRGRKFSPSVGTSCNCAHAAFLFRSCLDVRRIPRETPEAGRGRWRSAVSPLKRGFRNTSPNGNAARAPGPRASRPIHHRS